MFEKGVKGKGYIDAEKRTIPDNRLPALISLNVEAKIDYKTISRIQKW